MGTDGPKKMLPACDCEPKEGEGVPPLVRRLLLPPPPGLQPGHGDAGAEGVRGPAVAAVTRRAHLLQGQPDRFRGGDRGSVQGAAPHPRIHQNQPHGMGQVPTIVDGRFRLFESHAILRYLATVFPGVPDHWYDCPPSLGLTPNPETAKEGEKLLSGSLSAIETVWLKGDAKFLNGNPQPSIADLSLVCEIMQLEVVGDERRDSILRSHEKVRAWMENVKKATSPHFDEVHELIFKLKARLSLASHLKPASKL